jgi:hypothetical protein
LLGLFISLGVCLEVLNPKQNLAMIQKTNNKNIFYFFVVLFALVCAIFLFTLTVSAEQNSNLTVTPGVITVELTEPNQVKDTEITINSTFLTQISLEAALSGVDDSSGTLVAKGPIDENLEKSLTLSETQVNVPANGSESLYLRVTNSDSLSPGGHYAALTLSQIAQDGSQINLQSTISISIYIIKRGGEKIDLQITNLFINSSLFKLPTESSIEFKNTGNVLITPRASVTVRSTDGKIVYAKGVSNQGSQSILPEKSLPDTFSINNVNSLPFLPQKLKIITEYRAEGIINARYTELYFWYISPFFVLGLLIVITLIIVMIIRSMKRQKKKKKSTAKPKSKKSQPTPQMIYDIKPVEKDSTTK